MLTGTVTGPATLGFPQVVHDSSVPYQQELLPLSFHAGNWTPPPGLPGSGGVGGGGGGTADVDAGSPGAGFSVFVNILGPDPTEKPVTLPYPPFYPDAGSSLYMVTATLVYNDATSPTAVNGTVQEQLTVSSGTLSSSSAPFSNSGLIQSEDLVVTLSLMRSDGSVFDVDAHLDVHYQLVNYCVYANPH